MHNYSCPACGAPGSFHSSVSVYAVCPYCSSMILRQGLDVEAFGKMSSLPPDMSPLRIGARGKLDGEGFMLIGRLKVGWKDGTWNEWFLVTDLGRQGWLAEAQGFFAVCFERALMEDGRPLVNRDFGNWKPRVYEHLYIGRDAYQITDRKTTKCLGSEGELPFKAQPGRRAVSIDLEADGGWFAGIELHGKSVRIFTGRYAGWDELNIEDARPLEGW